MFRTGEYVLGKKDNKKYIILKTYMDLYLVKSKGGFEEVKFEHEIEKYNYFKMKWREFKNGGK